MKCKQNFGVIGLGSLLAMSLLMACDPVPELRQLDLGDVRAPILLSQSIADDGRIILDFDEGISLIPDSLHLTVGPAAGSSRNERQEGQIRQFQPEARTEAATSPAASTKQLQLILDGHMQIGREYAVELAVRDAAGNSLTMVMPFFGPNPHPATVVLNEVLAKLSTKNRDALELFVQESGNIGGLTIFLGVPLDYDACFTFPAINVTKGDYVVLHCKPEGKDGEIDEIRSLDAASGLNCLPEARDFWWREAPGLPDETAIITLADNPLGTIKDAVFYTNKITVNGKDYRSFGTKKMLDRAEALQKALAWQCAGTQITPEDGCRSDSLTSTRTLCRDSNSTDSNNAGDWHVVPTKGASLGSRNSDERHVPAN